MDEDTILKIRQIISEHLNIDINTVTRSSTPDDLYADSLDLIEIVMGIEDRFNLEIQDDDIFAMTTIGDLIDHVGELLKEKFDKRLVAV